MFKVLLRPPVCEFCYLYLFFHTLNNVHCRLYVLVLFDYFCFLNNFNTMFAQFAGFFFKVNKIELYFLNNFLFWIKSFSCNSSVVCILLVFSSCILFLGSKITVDGDCNHEIKRCLLLESKAMTNLDSILTSRDINLPTKVHLVKLWLFQ